MTPTNPGGTLEGALDLHAGDCIAFVGAGGKTSLMLVLAEELHNMGFKVAVTTTTKMGTTELIKNSELIVQSGMDFGDIIAKLHDVLTANKIPTICSRIDVTNDRLIGIEPKTADRLTREVDYLLIEADGARRKPFKIPMPHEPVVPECVNKLCIVIGLDALDQQIDEEHFYNVDGMVNFGAARNEPLTPIKIRTLLFQPNGYIRFKTKARERELYLLLNKFDKLTDSNNFRTITDELFHNAIEGIILTSTKTYPTMKMLVDNNQQKIGGVILAAGRSTRFEGLKQNAEIGGKTLANHITNQALASNLDEVILVVGHRKDEVINGVTELLDNKKLILVTNEDYQSGMSTSLISGLKNVQDRSDATMFILGDQPKVTTELINKLITAYKHSNAKLCLPVLNTPTGPRNGNPVIISKPLYPELLQITGDIGAREVVKNNISYAKLIEFSDECSQFQINTRDDLMKYIGAKK